MLKLDFEGKDVQFSTHFKNICCVGTFDVLNWYHKGSIFVINTKKQRVLKKFDNKIGVHKLSLSENYPEILISANHDGSMNIWDINKSKMVSNIVCEEGYPLSSVNWNNLIQNLILVGSTSSRIELFDSNNFSEILTIFAEHTKSVNDVKWNPNNQNEFASCSDDGLLKIWDKRQKTSINTLMNRKDICALKALDWNKRDDWIISVATSHDKFLIWDVRNSLQPIKVQFAHTGIVYDVRFDSTNPDLIASCGKDRIVRIWDTKTNIDLSSEHKMHQSKVNALDWDIHDSNSITSIGSDNLLITKRIDIVSKHLLNIRNKLNYNHQFNKKLFL